MKRLDHPNIIKLYQVRVKDYLHDQHWYAHPWIPGYVSLLQVMETKNMIYIVSEYASQGEIFGKWLRIFTQRYIPRIRTIPPSESWNW